MTTSTTLPARSAAPATQPFPAAPGSTAVVRDEEWLVTAVEPAAPDPATGRPTYFVSVIGLTGITRDTEATFWTQIDHVQQSDPAHTEVVGDDSPGHRRSRLWLEAMLRKTPVPISTPTLTTAPRALADHLSYQHAAVRQVLGQASLRSQTWLRPRRAIRFGASPATSGRVQPHEQGPSIPLRRWWCGLTGHHENVSVPGSPSRSGVFPSRNGLGEGRSRPGVASGTVAHLLVPEVSRPVRIVRGWREHCGPLTKETVGR